MTLDITDTLAAKSEQLNADDLAGGPVTVRIEGVEKTGVPEQPLVVRVTGGYKPWRPCKTMRRLLAAAWGADAGQWIGRWVTLYREPTVKWAGEQIGGIRVSALSHIERGMTIKLQETKGGKKLEWRVSPLVPPSDEVSDAAFRAALRDAMKAGWTAEQLEELMGGKGSDVPPSKRGGIVERLKDALPDRSDADQSAGEGS